jgi:hypothetical protein
LSDDYSGKKDGGKKSKRVLGKPSSKKDKLGVLGSQAINTTTGGITHRDV